MNSATLSASMKRCTTLTSLLAIATLVVSGCEAPAPTAVDDISPAYAMASTFTSNLKISIANDVFVPCAADGAGELVSLSGSLHSLIHTTINGSHITSMVHNQPQGVTGTGLSTGDKYQGTGVTQLTLTGSLVNGSFSNTSVNNFRVVGQGNGNNLLVHQNFHFNMNANGDVTAFVDNFRVECK